MLNWSAHIEALKREALEKAAKAFGYRDFTQANISSTDAELAKIEALAETLK